MDELQAAQLRIAELENVIIEVVKALDLKREKAGIWMDYIDTYGNGGFVTLGDEPYPPTNSIRNTGLYDALERLLKAVNY